MSLSQCRSFWVAVVQTKLDMGHPEKKFELLVVPPVHLKVANSKKVFERPMSDLFRKMVEPSAAQVMVIC